MNNNIFTSLICDLWDDMQPEYPDNYTCPANNNVQLLVSADNLNPVKDCYTGGDEVVVTVSVKNNNQASNRNIRALINADNSNYVEFVVDPTLDFNCTTTSSGNTELRITNPVTSGCDEEVSAFFEANEVKQFKFKVRYKGGIPAFSGGTNAFVVKVYSGSAPGSSLANVDFAIKPFVDIVGGNYSTLYANNQWDNNNPLFIKDNLVMNMNFVPNAGNTYDFAQNGKLLFAPGKGLEVANTKTTMIHVDARGCDNMWKGITVRSNSVFESDMMTSIEDADVAIKVQKGGSITIKNTRLLNNNFGIHTDPTGSGNYNITLLSNRYGATAGGLKPAYSGQLPLPLEKGYAGIYLNNAGSVVLDADPNSGDPNVFFNLKYGIISLNTNLIITQSDFQDITRVTKGSGYNAYPAVFTGKAIYAEKGLLTIIPGDNQTTTFSNCHTGVETLGASSYVWLTTMDNMTNGIITTNGVAIHDFNTITASTRGIDLRYLPPLGFATPAYPVTTFGGVYGNTIDINGNSKARAVSVAGILTPLSPSGPTGAPLFMGGNINGNTINMNDGQTAIHINDASLVTAARNNVSLANAQNNRFGMYLGAGDKNTLSCNNVTGPGATGIYAIHPGRASILCNLAANTGEGLHIEGMLVGKDKADIGGNLMKNNATGLLYGVDAITGEQVHRGNRWEGGLTKAQHFTPQIAEFSKYVVDNAEDDEFMPDQVDPFNWFENISTQEETYQCATPGYCITPGVTPGVTSDQYLDIKIARGELPGADYAAANNWLAQRRLYERLTEEGNPYPNDPDIDDFLGEAQSGGLAGFADLQKGIRQLYSASQSDRDSFQVYEAAIRDGLDSLAAVERQLNVFGISAQDSTALSAQRDVYLQTIAVAATSKENLLNNRASTASAAASGLLTQNTALSSTSVYAVTEKTVNDILLRTVAQGVFTFSAQDSATLVNIAERCPLSDGEAVLRARALLTLVEETPETYDDEAICGIERGQPGFTVNFDYLTVYPNPAKDRLTIAYSIAGASGKNFLLWNMVGQLVKTVELTEDSGRIDLDLEGQTPGIYWYALPGLPGLPVSGKILISR
ncbi:MAG: T9SS type A sorting domain-containing protein [Lewinellaceae bacterium]|nr:T9SS type A sorting domain-containing protein [Lewinellaceae bacterium]